jgi:DNA-binding NarL/FixJ family response regulator
MRVMIAEDTMLTREGIARLLRDAGVDVVAEVGNGSALLREVALAPPDAVIVDIKMPPTHTDEGLVTAQEIRRNHPQVGILVLSQYVEPAYATRLLHEHPARIGYLLKERVFDVAILLDALTRIQDGESVVDPTIVGRLMRRPRVDDPVASLTDREREVLAAVSEGLSNKAIAARLGITERTVEAHITQLFNKLGITGDSSVHRRVLAVLTYLRH